jgi:Vanin C-terminal domain
MMLSRVPKRPTEYSFSVEKTNIVKRFTTKEMDNFFLTTIAVKKTQPLLNNKMQKICAGTVCCELFVRFTAYSVPATKLSYSYRFSIFADKESHMDDEQKVAEYHCAIVACTKDTTEHCGSRFSVSDDLVPSIQFNEIRMRMIVELNDAVDEDLMVMPSNVDFRLVPLPVSSFEFTTGEVFIENG